LAPTKPAPPVINIRVKAGPAQGLYAPPVDYEHLDAYRFRDVDQARRREVWAEIARWVTENALASPRRLLDPAAERREFIDAAPAPERWAVDQVTHADAGSDDSVNFVASEIMDAELPEHLYAAGFEVVSNTSRFLPYSFTGRLPARGSLTRAYLRMPLAWRLLGTQVLVVGRR
jgi:hypothetical protein